MVKPTTVTKYPTNQPIHAQVYARTHSLAIHILLPWHLYITSKPNKMRIPYGNIYIASHTCKYSATKWWAFMLEHEFYVSPGEKNAWISIYCGRDRINFNRLVVFSHAWEQSENLKRAWERKRESEMRAEWHSMCNFGYQQNSRDAFISFHLHLIVCTAYIARIFIVIVVIDGSVSSITWWIYWFFWWNSLLVGI